VSGVWISQKEESIEVLNEERGSGGGQGESIEKILATKKTIVILRIFTRGHF